MNNKAKVGLLCIGLDTYWDQFDGLLDRLLTYKNTIKSHLEKSGTVVVDAQMIDNPTKATVASEMFAKENVEIIFVYISTYALSSTVLPLAYNTNAKIVLLNIQPKSAIDYNYINSMADRGAMTGEWLANCQSCSLPEIVSVLKRINKDCSIITGHLEDNKIWIELDEWLAATNVVYVMRKNRLGVLGHYYCGMLDVYTDLTRQCGAFGTHIELLEMCQLKKLRDNVTPYEIEEKISEFHKSFIVDDRCSDDEINRAARTAVALDKLIEINDLGSLAYYYEGEGEYQNIVTSVIAGNTLLTSRGIPVAGECEVKNAQAMKIMSAIGAGGSFSEFYAMDFDDDIVMLGHDGPAHKNIAEGSVKLVPLPIYHGKPGCGLSIQMSVKRGKVTLLSVCEDADGVFLLVAEGESVEGPVLNIGNTNSRYRFLIGATEFINRWSMAGPSHHCAIGVGHIASIIDKFSKILNLRVTKIC